MTETNAPSAAFDAMTQALNAATPEPLPVYWLEYADHFQGPALAVANAILDMDDDLAADVDEMFFATYVKGWDMGVSIVSELFGIEPEVMQTLLEIYREKGLRKPFPPALIERLRAVTAEEIDTVDVFDGELGLSSNNKD